VFSGDRPAPRATGLRFSMHPMCPRVTERVRRNVTVSRDNSCRVSSYAWPAAEFHPDRPNGWPVPRGCCRPMAPRRKTAIN
jgi:hypothetical protein